MSEKEVGMDYKNNIRQALKGVSVAALAAGIGLGTAGCQTGSCGAGSCGKKQSEEGQSSCGHGSGGDKKGEGKTSCG